MSVLGSIALGTIANEAKSLVVDAARFVAEHPWPAATMGFGTACGWLLFVTIPGLETDRDREIAAHQETKDGFRQAQRDAYYEWAKEAQRYQAELDALATEIDNARDEGLREGRAYADRYIADNRVQQCAGGKGAGGNASGAAGESGNNGSGISTESPTLPVMVAVRERDIRACTDLYSYAKSAHDWAMSLNK